MAVRLVISMQARAGKGADLLRLMEERCQEVRKEPGCEQFEVFQSGRDPDRLVLLELWSDQAALDEHAARPPSPEMASMRDLRADGVTPREDYEYNRTR